MLKNITLSAEAELIEKARHKASGQKKTLNKIFREWLGQYVQQAISAKEYDEMMQKLGYAKSAGSYTREEMNERK